MKTHLRAARASVKVIGLEVSLAVFAAGALALWGLAVLLRVWGTNVSDECLALWNQLGPDIGAPCAGPVQAFGNALAEDGERIVGFAGIVPFAVGLLAGVPIVAREVEGRTAQTAWWLDPSRVRWLARRAIPVAVVAGLPVVAMTAVVSQLEAYRVLWGDSASLDIGHFGFPLAIRAMAAFGLGVFVGSVVGRSLPAFFMSAILIAGLVSGFGVIHEKWLAGLDAHPVADVAREVQTGWAWLTPEGTQLTEAAAFDLVPPEVTSLDAGLAQAVNSLTWLEERGYRSVAIGVTEEVAAGWQLFDGLLFAVTGLVGIGGAALIVSRKRPV